MFGGDACKMPTEPSTYTEPAGTPVQSLPLTPLLSLALSVALPLPLRAQDTTSTKQALLAADRALATDLAVQGAAAFFDHVAPDAAVLIPDAPIYDER